jgi:Fe-S cluster assembly iron-binding protein IscA
MALDEPKDGDQTFEYDGITYMIETPLFEKAKPIKVDYITTPRGSGFSISSNLPKDQSTACGGGCSGC